MSLGMSDVHPSYSELPAVGPYAAAIGSALITMVEPHAGHERSYNRWYEDDHYYAGALAMPWMFAGRRWVSPPALRALRVPADSSIAQPVTTGRYISLYWITEGRNDDHIAWTVATNKRLRGDRRGFEHRTHVYTSFQAYLGPSYRDATGPRDIHSLDYPYQGLVVEVVDAPDGAGFAALDGWLAGTYLPELRSRCTVLAQSLRFRPRPLPKVFADVEDVPGVDRRITMLHFLDAEPSAHWSAFAGNAAMIDRSGLGRLEFGAPFLPTLPGTDNYVEETP